jgi:hypothetical protein
MVRNGAVSSITQLDFELKPEIQSLPYLSVNGGVKIPTSGVFYPIFQIYISTILLKV